MIEKALVCGQIGQALFKKEDRLFLLHAGETEQAVDCTPYEEGLFFDSDSEIKVFENLSIAELRKNLLKEKLHFDALHHTIAGFDGSLSEKTRILSIRKAETLVNDPGALSFVESRLLGNPVPREADLENAVKLSAEYRFGCMNSLYSRMLEGSGILDYISASFKELIFENSLENEYTRIKNIFITSGFFAKLFFIAQAKVFFLTENPSCEFCADEKERENIINIYRSLWVKLKNKYSLLQNVDFWSSEIEGSTAEASLLSRKIGISKLKTYGPTNKDKEEKKIPIYHEDYVGCLKASKTAGMIKMNDPIPYGALPGKSRLKKRDHKF